MLLHPTWIWVISRTKVKNLSSIMRDDKQRIQSFKVPSVRDTKIHSDNFISMIGKKSFPTLSSLVIWEKG